MVRLDVKRVRTKPVEYDSVVLTDENVALIADILDCDSYSVEISRGESPKKVVSFFNPEKEDRSVYTVKAVIGDMFVRSVFGDDPKWYQAHEEFIDKLDPNFENLLTESFSPPYDH